MPDDELPHGVSLTAQDGRIEISGLHEDEVRDAITLWNKAKRFQLEASQAHFRFLQKQC